MNATKLIVVLALAVSTCAIPAAAVDLVYAPTSLSFLAVVGTNPQPQTVNAYPSVAGTAFTPAVSSSVSWISLSTASAASLTTATNVFVAVNTLGLTPGLYNGQVTITQAGFNKSPAIVAVSLQIFPAGISYSASPAVLDVNAAPGVNASSQFFTVTTVGSATVKPTVTATTSAGGNWIALAAPVSSSLNTQTSVRVDFNTAGLANGFYTGVISVAGVGVQNSPLSIPVNLTVGTSATGPSLSVSPASLSFAAATGANPSPVALTINNTGLGTIFPTLTTSTVDGNAWLNVALTGTPGAGGSTTATVSINVGTLANGSYTGSIVIRDGAALNSPVTIPVSLTIQVPNPLLAVSPKGITFLAPAGSTVKVTSTLALTNAGTGALNFTAVPSTTSGGTWLSVSPTSGAASATLTVTADPTNLSGIYTGAITVSIAGTQVSQTIPVVFGVGAAVPSVNVNGIVNGASFASNPVAPGEIVSAFGLNLGPVTGPGSQAVGGFLTTSLAGISVTFDGTPAPLYFVGATQINMQVPWEVAGKTTTTVVVNNNGLLGLGYALALRPLDPAVFVVSGGRMAVLNQAGAQITTSNPASAGQILSIYATGLGSVDQPNRTGQLATGTLSNTVSITTVSVGSANASVSFAGLAPGFVGLYQINFTVPAGVATGDQPLVLGIGNITSAPLPLAIR